MYLAPMSPLQTTKLYTELVPTSLNRRLPPSRSPSTLLLSHPSLALKRQKSPEKPNLRTKSPLPLKHSPPALCPRPLEIFKGLPIPSTHLVFLFSLPALLNRQPRAFSSRRSICATYFVWVLKERRSSALTLMLRIM